MSDTWAPMEGKYGRTRDGQKVGPMRRWIKGSHPWTGDTAHGATPTYTDKGFWNADGIDHHYDLISEWVEPVAELRKVKTGDRIRITQEATDEARPHIGKVVRAFIDHDGDTCGHIDGCQPFFLLPNEWEFADAPEAEGVKEPPREPTTPPFPIEVWDQYAMAALPIAIQNCQKDTRLPGETVHQIVARATATLADAMMAERDKRMGEG